MPLVRRVLRLPLVEFVEQDLGWSDVVVITATNNIVLYANYGSNVWQMYGIDNLGGTCVINDADLGVLQS